MFSWFKKLIGRPQDVTPKSVTSSQGSQPYQQIPKQFVFNETGNILICTTKLDLEQVSQPFQESCYELSVFFSAMTKAITSSINPDTNQPYSLYNFNALTRVLNSSGLFIHLNQEVKTIKTSGVGNAIGNKMMTTVFGHDFGQNEFNFSKAMFNGMKEQVFTGRDGCTVSQSGNIFFICESLLGMPMLSAVLVKIDPQSAAVERSGIDKYQNLFDLALKDETEEENKGIGRTWKIEKQTYSFIAPKLLKHYGKSLSIRDEPELNAYIDRLKSALNVKQ